ncbi:MAG: DUF4334 domain-containing protein [Leptolyngbyaceae bacterium]|nr:DUF4334 domain-containing protein [Leptolyngbyaceae bacterium]
MYTTDSSTTLEKAIANHTPLTTAAALEIYDSLDPVDIEFMIGRWQGQGVPSNHPMDGLLEAGNWYGKEFINADHVHPLLMRSFDDSIIKVAPNPTIMSGVLKMPTLDTENPLLKPMFGGLNAVLQTQESQARLRMMEHRGQVTATMIYDYLPIHDSFRKLDENRVFGVMDYKEIDQPFFFVLTRAQ